MDQSGLASAFRHQQRRDYEKQMAAERGPSGGVFDDAGPPSWNRASWEGFRAKYGEYPFSAELLPPSFEGCPPWAYELMGLRVPPVAVTPRGS